MDFSPTSPIPLDVYHEIFERLSTIQLLRTRALCRAAKTMVEQWKWDINILLAKFFTQPLSFRSIQARTSTLISGSQALQYLGTWRYPTSDLDLYTHPGRCLEIGHFLLADGYFFVPTRAQDSNFDTARWSKMDMDAMEDESSDRDSTKSESVKAERRKRFTENEQFHRQHYGNSGVKGVFTFQRKPSRHGVPGAVVQIIESQTTPIDCILQFHSTVVLNFITSNTAYSLYPEATFDAGILTANNAASQSSEQAVKKYMRRGWFSLSPLRHEFKDELDYEPSKDLKESPTIPDPSSFFFFDKPRMVGDSRTWKLPLNTDGVTVEPEPGAKPASFNSIELNSWTMECQVLGNGYKHSVGMMRVFSRFFAHKYCVADKNLWDMVVWYLREEGPRRQKAVESMSIDERQRTQWIWTDASVKRITEEYLARGTDAHSEAKATWERLVHSKARRIIRDVIAFEATMNDEADAISSHINVLSSEEEATMMRYAEEAANLTDLTERIMELAYLVCGEDDWSLLDGVDDIEKLVEDVLAGGRVSPAGEVVLPDEVDVLAAEPAFAI